MGQLKKMWYKIKAIPAIGIPYEKYIGTRKVKKIAMRQTREINENGISYIEIVENLLRSSNALFYAYAGTLLGIIRDQNLLKWDSDIDYAIVITEAFGWEDLHRIMRVSGYNKVTEYVYNGEIIEQAYQIGKLKIDFFGQFYEADAMIQYSCEQLSGIKYPDLNASSVYRVTLPKVSKTKCVNIDGVAISVPENAEDILASIYNDDWRVPNPNWKTNSGKGAQLIEDQFVYQVVT